MRFHRMIIAAPSLLLSALPALALPIPIPIHHFAPVPAAGAGLGFAAIAGGYYAVRRWREWKAKK